MILKLKWAVIATALFFCRSYAQDSDSLVNQLPDSLQFQNEVQVLDEVLIRPDYVKKSGIVLPTSEVNEDQINQYSPIDIVSSINRTPGVFIQNGALNTNRITIRGVGARTPYGTNKIRAYYQNIPITNGVGATAIDAYNAEDLQNIEIVKGPKATLFGTNLGGTLLLQPKTTVGDQFNLSNSTTLGSYALFKNSTSINYKKQKLRLHFNYDHASTNGYRENDDYTRDVFFLSGDYQVTSKTTINILLTQQNYMAYIPSSINEQDFTEEPTKAAFTWASAKGYEDDKQTITGLSLTHRFTDSLKNTTSIFYKYNDHYEPRPFNILDEFTSGYGVRSVFDKTFQVFQKSGSAQIGTEWQRDSYNWNTFENLYEQNNDGSLQGEELSANRELRNQLNVFGQLNYEIASKLETQIGLNVNFTDYDYNDLFQTGANNTSGERYFDPILAPSFSLMYKLSSTKLLFANVSRGFNHPSLEETLTPEGMVNTEIAPAQGWNYEIGSKLSFFKNKLSLDASAYLLQINDLLVAQRVGNDQYIGRNAGQTTHRGIELSAAYTIVVNNNHKLVPYSNASFNFHKFDEFVDNENDYSGNELTGVPNRTIASGLVYSFKNKLAVAVNHIFVGAMPMNDENEKYSSPYNVLNINVKYNYAISQKFNIAINGGINNVLNEKYASSILINATGFGGSQPRYYYPGLPINFYAGLKLSYNLR